MTTTHEFDSLAVDRGEGVDVSTPSATRRVGRWEGWFVRLRAGSLDADLARGLAPASRRQLAVRAHQLVATAARAELADAWADLLADAEAGTVHWSRAPLNRRAVLTSAGPIQTVVAALRAPAPVPVRAVAAAQVLLTDGTGPLYRRRSAAGLGLALAAVIHAFDAA